MGGGSKTTTTNENQQATTTPTTPAYALGPVQNYFQGVGNYQNADPYAFTTPINALQQGAFQNASGLFQTGDLYGQAAQGAAAVQNANPATYAAGQTAGQVGNLAPAAQSQAAQVGAPTLGQAAQAGPVSLAGNASQVQAASLLDNLSAYQNPATQSLVSTTLSSMDDNAGRVRAAQQAQFARSGAFGGSRAGITQAQTEADLARERGLAEANLRSQAWNAATQLSGMDAANRQQASIFNAGSQNQRDETLAGLNVQNNQFNTGQQNQFSLAGANLAADANQFNAGSQNAANQFNAGQQNQFSLAGFDAGNQMSQFNAGQGNQLSMFNAGQMNDATNQNLSRQLQASGLLSDIGGAYGSNYRADLSAMSDLGSQLYGLENIYNQAPLTQLQNVGNLLNPGMIDTLSSKTVTGSTSGVSQQKSSGGLFNSLLGAASVAAPFFSDRRLKRDVELIGREPDGLGRYHYAYHWEGPGAVREGVMADEVAQLRPWALGPKVNGFATVDYSRLEMR